MSDVRTADTPKSGVRAAETARLMIVDDTPDNLRLLSSMLREEGHDVRLFPNGRMALQAARQEAPDLVLLDVHMPGMNGFEVCEQLKDDEQLAPVPVIFLSAEHETESKLRAFRSGGVDYVTKPFHVEEIRVRVETHLRIRRLQHEAEERSRQLARNLDRLQRLESLRDDLTQMIVHDLRSPLHGILGYLELLATDVTPSVQGFVSGARESAGRMATMIDTLLDVHRLENGKMPVNRSPCDLVRVIGAAVASLGAATQGGRIEFDLPPRLDWVCDTDLIERTIANLVANAIRFSPPGESVLITAAAAGSEARVSVLDRGSGVAPEHRQRIFEKFGQVELREEKRQARRSTGLGLTFCKLAVEAHGGDISVSDREGGGSDFRLLLPRSETS